jgi:tRNA (cmo5U34)-methyltransferase
MRARDVVSDRFDVPPIRAARVLTRGRRRGRRARHEAMTDAPYAFDPATYAAVVTEVPEYERLQAEVAAATVGLRVGRFLDLGAGTGATTLSVLAQHPEASVVVLDESESMLVVARSALGEALTLVVADLADPLPDGPFDLVVSALAVPHLDGAGKADLFRRVARVLAPSGRFVLGDLVVPEDPTDVVTAIDGVVDLPSPAADQLAWLEEAGLTASTTWSSRDLAVLVGTKPQS